MINKKNILSVCILFFVSSYAMDSDVFGGYLVLISNELNAQEIEKEQKYIKKYMEKKKEERRALDYNPTEVKILTFGVLATVAIFVFDYMK